MLSSIIFINMRGDVLIYRIYKDDINRTETFNFCTRLIANKNKKETPVLYLDGTTFFYVPYKDFILVAATKTNVNCGMVFQFLYSILTILTSYFAEEPTEALIKAKYVLIYEILDEIIDYGIPQITEPKVLQEFITEAGIKLEKMSDLERLKKITTLLTSANAWRPEGIKYQKNQVWIDIIESVNVLLSNKGNVLKADITGAVEFTSQLSGIPECKFTINDKFSLQRNKEGEIEKCINIDDLKFDRCVKLSKFDRENAITFIPPDGKFILMTYRVSNNNNFTLPFKIMCIYNELSPTKINYQIKLKSIFDAQFFAQSVVLTIPTPKNVLNANSSSPKGKAKYEPDKKAVMWRIKKFNGQTEVLISTDIEVSSDGYANWIKPPLSLEFTVPMTTASGLKVLSLRVMEKSEDYKVTKWIKYLTKSGDYFQRV